MRKCGFVRTVRGSRAKDQEARLHAAGYEPIYSELPDCIAALRKGDVVAVWGGLHILSPIRRGMVEIVDEVHALGCTIVDAESGQSSAGDGVPMLGKALDAVAQEQRFGDTSKAGKRGAAKRWAKAKKPKRTPKRQALGPWRDRRLTIEQALAHPDMKGWNRSAAYRELGSRGIFKARN